MASLLQQLREGRARRQVEVLNRQLYREQRRLERRQRLRWELERRWSGRPRPDVREWDVRRRWVERPRPTSQQPAAPAPARPPRDLRYGVAVGRVVAAVLVLLVGGTLAGYAVVRAVDDPETGTASVEGAVRPAAGPSDGAMPGITDPGVFLSVTRDDAGDLVATERVRATEPLGELSIVPPPALPDSRWLPRLDDVELTVDGEPVALPDEVDTIEVTTVVPLTEPGSLVELRYRVVGVTTPADQARKQAGRQLSVISLRPALGPMLGDMKAAVEVYGARVHELTCVDRWKRRRDCGVDLDDGWRTRPMPATKSAVLVVVDRGNPAT